MNIKSKNIVISFLVTVGLFILYRSYTDFIYLTNDDMYLQSIVAGELSGTPNAHMIYSSALLGVILSGLYRMNAGIPWYGLYLVLVCAFCYWIILYRCLSRAGNNNTKMIVIFSFSLISSCVFFRHVAMIQYTVVSALAGASAVFYAMTMDMEVDKKTLIKECYIVLLLAGISFLIRNKVFFMMVPFATCGWLAKWITQINKTKKMFLRYVFLLIEIFGMVVVLLGIEWALYSISPYSSEWKEYSKYNKARERILDYNSFPPFDSNADFYKDLDITREEYEAARSNYFLLPQKKIQANSMELIANRAELLAEKRRWSDVITEFIRCNINYTDRPMNICVYSVWILAIALMILIKSDAIFVQLLSIFIARMGTWGFILYQGRYPDRITQSLYLVELLMLIAVLLQILPLLQLKKWHPKKKIIFELSLIILIFPFVYIAIPKAKSVKGEIAGKLYFGSSYQQVKEYCTQRKENLYLIDMNSVANFSSSIFKSLENENGICNNLLPLGSWPVKSPIINENFMKYQIDDVTEDLIDNEFVYFIFKDSEVTTTEYLSKFYEAQLEYEELQISLHDKIETDAGIDYGIYQLHTIKE